MADQGSHTHLPSQQVVRAIVITPMQSGAPPILIVEVEIACAVCGGFEARFAGHHVAGLANALQKLVEAHPGLTGEAAGETLTTEWSGMAPGPGKAEMN